MSSAVQYIVTPSAERLVVLPEDEYLCSWQQAKTTKAS
jgi:hypothetical protein